LIRVVFWIPQGRLGNIIFQYQALINIFNNNSVRIFGISNDFFNCIKIKNNKIKIIPVSNFTEKYIIKYISNILSLLIILKIFSYYTPKVNVNEIGYSDEDYHVEKKNGFFKSIIVFRGFCQHDKFIEPTPVIKDYLLKNAEENLKDIPIEKRIAIHLRFGDYSNWSVYGMKNVILPDNYYLKAIEYIKLNIQNPVFIVFSDDIVAANKIFNLCDDMFIYHNAGTNLDFAAITSCSHAIISASTYSWWAAMLIKNDKKIIIAPNYWAGFRSKMWHPKNIKVKAFMYIEVEI